MGEGFGERETSLVEGEGPAEDDAGDLVRGSWAVFDNAPHRLKTFLMVEDQLSDSAVQVVKDGSVAGEHEVRVEAAHAVEGLQVAGQRMRVGLRPEPDVGGDPEQQVVRGEQDAPRLVVEHDLVVRVPRGVDDASDALPERQLFVGTEWDHLIWERQGVPDLGGGLPGHVAVHPVTGQVCLEGPGFRGAPEFAGEGDLAFHHADRGPVRSCSQRAAPMWSGWKWVMIILT